MPYLELAPDCDGIIARDGTVDGSTLARLRAAGWRLVLATRDVHEVRVRGVARRAGLSWKRDSISHGIDGFCVGRNAKAGMGLVINPRGTGGAGKTWLVREVMAASRRAGATAEPLHREGRHRPIGWRLVRPRGPRPLAVIGHYDAARGGTDTIPLTDGGLVEAFRLAQVLATEGHDVLMEGYQLSGEVDRTAALARAQRARERRFHVLWLDVPLERCVRNLMARRRAGRDALPSIERTVRAGHAALTTACQALRDEGVDVERLDTDAALRRTLALLDLGPASPEGFGGGSSDSSPKAGNSTCSVEPWPCDLVARLGPCRVPPGDAVRQLMT